MEIVLAVVIGILYACGVYLLLRRSLIKLILGLVLISQASNLLIFTAGGLIRGGPTIIPSAGAALAEPHADPLPQALILTAIVISFGVLAFTIILVKQTYRIIGTSDLDELKDIDA